MDGNRAIVGSQFAILVQKAFPLEQVGVYGIPVLLKSFALAKIPVQFLGRAHPPGVERRDFAELTARGKLAESLDHSLKMLCHEMEPFFKGDQRRARLSGESGADL